MGGNKREWDCALGKKYSIDFSRPSPLPLKLPYEFRDLIGYLHVPCEL